MAKKFKDQRCTGKGSTPHCLSMVMYQLSALYLTPVAMVTTSDYHGGGLTRSLIHTTDVRSETHWETKAGSEKLAEEGL